MKASRKNIHLSMQHLQHTYFIRHGPEKLQFNQFEFLTTLSKNPTLLSCDSDVFSGLLLGLIAWTYAGNIPSKQTI
jgi:hypothetical protein